MYVPAFLRNWTFFWTRENRVLDPEGSGDITLVRFRDLKKDWSQIDTKPLRPWYLYWMVAQNTLHTCAGNNFKFETVVDVNNCL